MCGIVAVVRKRSSQVEVDVSDIVEAAQQLDSDLAASSVALEDLQRCSAGLQRIDQTLRSVSSVIALVRQPHLVDLLETHVNSISEVVDRFEGALDSDDMGMSLASESTNETLSGLKDVVWALLRDRLRAVREVARLSRTTQTAELTAMFSLHQALSALDRMEVRGRDSAGIEFVISDHGLDLEDPAIVNEIERRSSPLFVHESVSRNNDNLVFVYKAAFEIGELGDNTARLRASVINDDLLHRCLEHPDAHALILGHTRWASIGIISEPNAHPVNSVESNRSGSLVTAVLNGDVDNHAELVNAESLEYSPLITTDAKVIPTMIARRLDDGLEPLTAFRESVNQMVGSVAIGASLASSTNELFLALRGSGQGVYVGLGDDCFVVASEPYGVVEETVRYVRLDGETPADPTNPSASRGQILALNGESAGELAGLRRVSYDGTELELTEQDVATAEITTRDIDRGAFPHYLLKEITDAPSSFRKTLRGKLRHTNGIWSVVLDESTLPKAIAQRLQTGSVRRILVIGQGTAAVAGQSCAYLLSNLLEHAAVAVEAIPATELSGFRMRSDMSDTLVIAISQSGTTTDTNRTVDLVRGRGAAVIAIVNRRNSDLCDKVDGVLYTSDGRDVEMSVASTKAFYSQIAAGMLLASALAALTAQGVPTDDPSQQQLLAALHDLPDKLRQVIESRPEIAQAARTFAPAKRYWALVGNGPNQIAARELRIKLSELCYKSIACDATEDKKHIDLSAEPMVLVCAAGLSGSTADDVGKEVAIFRAHKATPIVIAHEGDDTFSSALAVLRVPSTDARVGFVLSAMVGHLFGYEAALAIDAQATPLRQARGVIEQAYSDESTLASRRDLVADLRPQLAAPLARFFAMLRTGELNGNLEAATAVRLAGIARFVTDSVPVDSYQGQFGKVGTPSVVIDDLVDALTEAIEELTRPVDAIKHQAKTVTVGISRSDESLVTVPLVASLFECGTPRDAVTYSTMRSLADLDVTVEDVLGYTRYRVDDLNEDGGIATVIDKGGSSAGMASRTDRDPRLRGTKHLVAREKELMVSQSRSDGRVVIIVPEIKDGATTGITLMHVRFADRLTPNAARSALSGYRRRYQSLRDAVTETEDSFQDDLLGQQSVLDLLCEPILDLAQRWRTAP